MPVKSKDDPKDVTIPRVIASGWAARPDLIGAWVDLAMSGKDVWTEGELSRRWGTGWSQVRVRWWLGLASEIGVVEGTGRTAEWRIVRPPAQPRFTEESQGKVLLIASRRGQYYHRDNCGAKAAMGGQNVCVFKTADDAVAQGYEPCQLCRPPQPLTSTRLQRAPFLRLFQHVSSHRTVVRYQCRLPKHRFDVYLPKSMISAVTQRRWPQELLIGIAEDPALLATYYFSGLRTLQCSTRRCSRRIGSGSTYTPSVIA
jgi:hypothetical protein